MIADRVDDLDEPFDQLGSSRTRCRRHRLLPCRYGELNLAASLNPLILIQSRPTCQNVEMRRGIAGAFYAVLAIGFLCADRGLLFDFHKTLLCDVTIVAFALGTIRGSHLAYDAYMAST